MIRFFKSLFGSKKVEEPAVPYKVEAPSQESAPAPVAAVAEARKEVTSVASKPASVPKKQTSGTKKQGAPRKQGTSKPRKPKAPKAPKAQ
jgi:hypothetical protein